MRFVLLPLIDTMLEYYSLPQGFERFKEYISLLTGGSGDDMKLPIGGFNPMGKEHVTEKLIELKNLGAEKHISEILDKMNSDFANDNQAIEFKVSISLADDLEGGWTNRYTTDYQHKFNTSAFIKRKFITIQFWTSDQLSKDLIEFRTMESVYRLIYQLQFPKQETLEEHIRQEAFVNDKMGSVSGIEPGDLNHYKAFYLEHKDSTDYPLIFNFLYGDKAAENLGYKPGGIKDNFAGFRTAKEIL
jgi:hypothetical protein